MFRYLCRISGLRVTGLNVGNAPVGAFPSGTIYIFILLRIQFPLPNGNPTEGAMLPRLGMLSDPN